MLPPSGIYHVTSRGVAKSLIARDDDDRRYFLVLLAREVRREGWDCHAFCLMPNHYHLVAATTVDSLSRGLRRLNGELAQSFNDRHKRWGHLSATASPPSSSATTGTSRTPASTF